MKKSTKNLICLAVFGALLIRNFQLMKQRDYWKSKAKANDPITQLTLTQQPVL
jgi:hypothetical protein